MFGPRLTRVFASRNNALWWSAMVLVTAYCVAAEPPVVPDHIAQKTGNTDNIAESERPLD